MWVLMNICVLTHTYPRFSGDPVAPFMKDFCLGLSQQKQNVTILTPYDKKFSLRENTSINLKTKLYRYIFPDGLHTLGYSRTLIGDQRLKTSVFFLAPLMFFASFFSLLWIIYKERIQVISAHWIIPNGFIAALASKITGVPLIVTIPGSDVYLGKKNSLFKFMTKFASFQAKAIVSNSMRYLGELADLGIPKEKFIEIPYGVNIKNFEHIKQERKVMRKSLGIKSSDLIILAVGRLVEKKGFDYLIKAIPGVLKEYKQIKLLIIGDGSEKNNLENLVDELKIKNKVSFLGRINHTDLPKYYSVADIYAAPSVKDKQGNLESHIVALFEAIASGLPVVATELAVSKKYVVDGKNGYRVKDKSVESLSDAIIRMFGSGRLPSMSIYSSFIAKKYLSYQFCTRKYIKLFNRSL